MQRPTTPDICVRLNMQRHLIRYFPTSTFNCLVPHTFLRRDEL